MSSHPTACACQQVCRLSSNTPGGRSGSHFSRALCVQVCKHAKVEEKALRCFQREVSILHNASHENIVRFIGACTWRVGARLLGCLPCVLCTLHPHASLQACRGGGEGAALLPAGGGHPAQRMPTTMADV